MLKKDTKKKRREREIPFANTLLDKKYKKNNTRPRDFYSY